jgi:bifunctional non-homologous end joining protein LigD
MTLDRHNQKHDLSRTKTPEATIEKLQEEFIFVVQKHAASHLHYDFRLEMGGVLISWAIPKGPSMNPLDKRLAIRVEDHPYRYKDFEGTISEGNYGAGKVIVWDSGTYFLSEESVEGSLEDKLKKGLQNGHFSFILQGEKLKGEFLLVKLKGKEKNAWLLIKKKDVYASDDDILKKNNSVISNETL